VVRAASDVASSSSTRPSCGRGDDFLVVVPKDGRSGHELCRGLREPVLHLQRLRIERDDRVRFAVAVVWPAPIAANSVPLDANATAPTTGPPLVFHDTTGFVSLSRSIAQTPCGAPPQPADVAVYNMVSTAIGEDHRAFAGRNRAGRCMSFPDGRPSTCSMPSLVIT